MNILIVGGGLQALSCGSSLYKKHIVSVVSNDTQIKYSRFFKHVYNSSIIADEQIYAILKEVDFDVLIPVSDVSVEFISKNKEYIEKTFGTKCAAPDFNLFSIVANKQKFMDFCKKNGIPHPKTERILSDNFGKAANAIGFPSLIKPNFSVGARGITLVRNVHELHDKFPIIEAKYGPCTLQEFVDNKEYYYNVMMYRDKSGAILGSVVIKIVRMFPVKGGSSTCSISVQNKELELLCKNTLDALNWYGMADFDVLQRLDNGEYKIIEINPRVPASLRAAEISGINFPEIMINDLWGHKQNQMYYVTGKILRYLGTDILWLLNTKKILGTHPSWLSFIGKEIYYQDIFANDYTTWWSWLIDGIHKLSNRNKRIR